MPGSQYLLTTWKLSVYTAASHIGVPGSLLKSAATNELMEKGSTQQQWQEWSEVASGKCLESCGF